MRQKQNLETIIETIDLLDLVLDENQIAKHKIPHVELFIIKSQDNEIGPIWAKNLIDYLDSSHQYIDPSAFIRSIDNNSWSPIYEHPRFSRRRPQIIKKQVLNEKAQIFVLINGVKKGPIKLSSLKKKLLKKEILYTYQISINDGNNWHKIYEFEELDRRSENTSALPVDKPTIVNRETKNIPTNTESVDDVTGTDDAIIGLVQLHKSRSKNILSQSGANEKKISTNHKYILYSVIGFICLLLFFIYLSTNFLSTNNKIKKKNSTYKNNLAAKKERSKPNTKANKIKKAQALKRRPRKTWKKSNVQTSRPQEKQEIIEEYYPPEDNAPFELDPIRKKLSRKTISDQNNNNVGEIEDELQENYPDDDAAQDDSSFEEQLSDAIEDEYINDNQNE